MKIYRYLTADNLPAYAAELPTGEFRAIEGDLFGAFTVGPGVTAPARLLAPLEPKVIFGIALNYRAHAAETGKPLPERPVYFIKLPTSVQHPGLPIALPTAAGSTQVDYEGELAVIIGKRGKNIAKASALEHVFGYTIANDVSARDWQYQWGGGQFNRAKSFDTFAPLGPCIVTADEIPNPAVLKLETRLNADIVQQTGVDDLVFDVPTLIAFLSASTTLEPGTVILTGTPSGVGHARKPPCYLKPGDTIAITIGGIGTLTNPVVQE
ncbi:MAG: fumarylacetoacetate hydrolase family protein [Verrucomicrobiota bacterium]|nr:fumarylacetoacetate hydrolase family protein [Verrucomicrobiota bacterium]